MAKALVSDELWSKVAPLLPVHTPSRMGGRPRLDDRAALTGLLFVLRTGIPWEMLPQEMGCGSGMTCWRRLAEWHAAGVWQTLHEILLSELRSEDKLDWSRAIADSGSIRAMGGGKKRAPIPRIEGNWGVSITS